MTREKQKKKMLQFPLPTESVFRWLECMTKMRDKEKTDYSFCYRLSHFHVDVAVL